MVCPFCGGGTSNERTLSIKRDEETGLILYHCFRANCGEAGVLGGSRSLTRVRPEPVKKFVPWDDGGLVSAGAPDMVPEGAHAQIREWGLDPYTVGWYYDARDDRICMPIRGPLYDLRGYVRRAYRDGNHPKALIGRIDNEHPLVAFHWPNTGEDRLAWAGRLVCVEDIPSAERLREKGVCSVALLGCTPSNEVLDELGALTRKGYTIVWALDADASGQAIRLQRKFGLRGASTVRFLHKDVKNMTRGELDAWLTNGP